MINIFGTINNLEVNLIKSAFDTFEKYFNIQNKTDVDLSFISKDEIKRLNFQHRKKDIVTDVLSFPSIEGKLKIPFSMDDYPYDFDLDSGLLFLGDIFICMDKVKFQASEYNNTIERELGYLTIHALLHLIGYDHLKDKDKKEMREKEELIFSLI